MHAAGQRLRSRRGHALCRRRLGQSCVTGASISAVLHERAGQPVQILTSPPAHSDSDPAAAGLTAPEAACARAAAGPCASRPTAGSRLAWPSSLPCRGSHCSCRAWGSHRSGQGVERHHNGMPQRLSSWRGAVTPPSVPGRSASSWVLQVLVQVHGHGDLGDRHCIGGAELVGCRWCHPVATSEASPQAGLLSMARGCLLLQPGCRARAEVVHTCVTSRHITS